MTATVKSGSATDNSKACSCHPPKGAGWGKRAGARIETLIVPLTRFLPALHAVMFVAFLALIIGPLFAPSVPPQTSLWRDLPSLSNYLLWGLWFPLVFLSVIATGRSWCGIFCPMGAAAEWGNKLGPKWAIPGWLRWQGTPVVSFLIITILGQTVGVRDHPEAVAEVFGGTMLAAILCGFLYGRRKRAWCRHACPIGLLLGVFSRLGAVQFASRTPLPGGEGYSEKGVCPTMIDLAHKTESRHCIECFRCVTPASRGGVHLELRVPGAEIERIRLHHANPWEVWFLFIGTGVALGGFLWLVLPQYQDWRQMLGENAVDLGWSGLLESGPWWLMSVHPDRNEVFLWLDFAMIVGFMLGCALLSTMVLGGLTALAAWVAARCGGDGGARRGFVELGYQYAPVAMVSLVVGLGGKLFDSLAATPLGPEGVQIVKGILFAAGLVWSIRLGERILAAQGLSPKGRLLALLLGIGGSLAVGLGWWPAIFGL